MLSSMFRGLRSGQRLYSTARSYYELFPKTFPTGPPPKGNFKIDAGQLRREFLQLQSATHPDKSGSMDPNDSLRKQYEDRSMQLNNAYKTLTNPLMRSEHLLKLQGVDALSERNSLEDPVLLMEILELREALMEVDNEEELMRLKEENDAKISQSEDVLQEAFAKEDLETAKSETIKLSYWQSMKQQINELRDKFH